MKQAIVLVPWKCKFWANIRFLDIIKKAVSFLIVRFSSFFHAPPPLILLFWTFWYVYHFSTTKIDEVRYPAQIFNKSRKTEFYIHRKKIQFSDFFVIYGVFILNGTRKTRAHFKIKFDSILGHLNGNTSRWNELNIYVELILILIFLF